MEKYEELTMEVIRLASEDVILTSLPADPNCPEDRETPFIPG